MTVKEYSATFNFVFESVGCVVQFTINIIHLRRVSAKSMAEHSCTHIAPNGVEVCQADSTHSSISCSL